MPGYYSPEISVLRGFWMVSWFKEEFGLKEQMLSMEKNVSAEKLLDEMIANVPVSYTHLTLPTKRIV